MISSSVSIMPNVPVDIEQNVEESLSCAEDDDAFDKQLDAWGKESL